MADFLSPEKRSELMSKVKSVGNATTEIAMVRAMRTVGISGWRRHLRVFSFRPDFVFRREKVAVFVDGCFWHSCPVHCRVPSSNVEFWRAKLESNRRRDLRANAEFVSRGWLVFRLWEHELKSDPLYCAERLGSVLSGRISSRVV